MTTGHGGHRTALPPNAGPSYHGAWIPLSGASAPYRTEHPRRDRPYRPTKEGLQP
jgi:hypothetical protein